MNDLGDTVGSGGPDGELFELVELWPVRLTLLRASGLTLWGSGGSHDGRDRVLTVGGRLVLRGSEPELRAFVAEDAASSMAELPGYGQLQRRVREGDARLDEQVAFDYRAVAHALDWPAERWGLDSCSALVDALNMLADLAEALQDDELLERFDDPGYVAQLERLTFVTEEELPEVVATLDRPALRQLIGMAIDHVEHRVTSG